MIISSSECWVIYMSGDRWSNPSLLTDGIYTVKADAEATAARVNSEKPILNSPVIMCHVTTLADWIDMVKDNAYDDGKQSARNEEMGDHY